MQTFYMKEINIVEKKKIDSKRALKNWKVILHLKLTLWGQKIYLQDVSNVVLHETVSKY